VVGHAELLTAVWGAGYRDDIHLLRVTIRNLRAKLTEVAPARRFLETSYGIGYRFRPGEELSTDA
jgi:two-component system KDP operon response regulator KdpE